MVLAVRMGKKSNIQAVVFDIGNVLINWQPEAFFDREIGVARRQELFASVDIYAMNERVDLGADFQSSVQVLADQHPQYSADILLWYTHWSDMVPGIIEGTPALMAALKARGVPVFALSNFGVGPFEIARERFNFLNSFDRKYISGDLGMIKPGAEIYAHLEHDCGLAPDGLLFTDDRADNIVAADARGWNTYRFTGAKGLAKRLVTDGLLEESDLYER